MGLPHADQLREIPLFADLSDDALEHIAAISTELECPAGTVLARADEPGSGMFVVEEGTVAVEARGQTIELGPGEFVGELTLLVPDSHRVARVRALTDIRCLAIGRGDFQELLDEQPRLAVAMLPVLAARLYGEMHPD